MIESIVSPTCVAFLYDISIFGYLLPILSNCCAPPISLSLYAFSSCATPNRPIELEINFFLSSYVFALFFCLFLLYGIAQFLLCGIAQFLLLLLELP
jgi:hypothetical protein